MPLFFPTVEEPVRPPLWDRMPPRWVLLTLLCAALVVRGRAMLANPQQLRQDPDAYREVAWNIAHEDTMGFWNYSTSSAVPTASRPPLYPLLLSVFDFIPVGGGAPEYGFLHVLLGVATVWCTWRLGLAWSLPPAAAIAAAALVTIDPILLGQSVQVMTETLATFLAAVSLLLLTRAAREGSFVFAALAGAALALCVLCRPSFLVWLVACAVCFAWQASGPHRIARCVALVLIATATLAPWTIRNAMVFGRPIVTTTHGGYTLLVANNPEYYEFLRTASWGDTWDAQNVLAAWNRGLELDDSTTGPAYGEVDKDRRAYQLAFANMRDDPAMFVYSCVSRLGRLFDVLPRQTTPDESSTRRGLRYAISVWYAFEFALVACGAWFLGRRLLSEPWLWGTLLVLSLAAVHTLYWTDMRMRAPLAIVIALAAGQGLLVLAGRKPVATDLAQPT